MLTNIFTVVLCAVSLFITLVFLDDIFGISKSHSARKRKKEYLENEKIHEEDLATNPSRRHFDSINDLKRRAWGELSKKQSIVEQFDIYTKMLEKQSAHLNLRMLHDINSTEEMEAYFSTLEYKIKCHIKINPLQAELGSRSSMLKKLNDCDNKFSLLTSIHRLKANVSNDSIIDIQQKNEIIEKIDSEFERFRKIEDEILNRKEYIQNQHQDAKNLYDNKIRRRRKIIERLWGSNSFVEIDRSIAQMPKELLCHSYVVRSTKLEQCDSADKWHYIYGVGASLDASIVALQEKIRTLRKYSKIRKIDPLNNSEFS